MEARPIVDDVGALAGRALGEGRDELGRGGPHVVADHDGATGGADDAHERRAEGARDLGVELVGDHAADVVGLDEGRQVVAERGERHARRAYRPARDGSEARWCGQTLRVLSSTRSTGRARALPCSAQVRCSQRWQEVKLDRRPVGEVHRDAGDPLAAAGAGSWRRRGRRAG